VLSGQFLIDSEASLSGTLARLQAGDAAHEGHAKPAGSKPDGMKPDGIKP
jgi:hypothetical protein